jgi:hypothetical protein
VQLQGIALKFEFSGWPVTDAGAPTSVVLLLHTWEDDSVVMMDVLSDGKAPTRLPEALWLRFAPSSEAAASSKLQINKITSWISPSEVVRDLHPVNRLFGIHNLESSQACVFM